MISSPLRPQVKRLAAVVAGHQGAVGQVEGELRVGAVQRGVGGLAPLGAAAAWSGRPARREHGAAGVAEPGTQPPLPGAAAGERCGWQDVGSRETAEYGRLVECVYDGREYYWEPVEADSQ